MLLLIVLAIIALTIYGIATSKITPEERDEMLNDENIFP
jgi:hypothetical protein